METKTIGGHEIHPVGIGTWGMGGDRFAAGSLYADYRNDERDAEAIRYSLSRGQNHIDTAQLYGAGHTEEIVGEAIDGLERESFYLATKVWRSHSLRNAVPKAAEDSLRKLRTDYIDLLYVHSPWDAIDMEEYIAGLGDAVDAGLVRAVGVSNFGLSDLERAVALSRHPIVANQLLYNVIERGLVSSEMRAYCRSNGITIVAYRPVERRLLADRTENPTVRAVASDHGCTPAQVAIRWLVQQEGVVTIPKASRAEHIDENLGALKIELSADETAALDGVAAAG